MSGISELYSEGLIDYYTMLGLQDLALYGVEGEEYLKDTKKTRFRTRARIGLKWLAPSENWEVAMGLVTGHEEDCEDYYGASAGNSGNDSWNSGGVWETGDIWLDYAYAKHSWDAFSLTLGQQKSPFTTTWLMFDSDLRPTGATGMYCSDMFFVTAGAYNLRSDATAGSDSHQSLANMYAGQIGLMLEMEPVSALLAVSYFHYDDETNEFTGIGANSDYQYQIGAVYGQLTGTIEEVAFKIFGEVAMNFGADEDASQLSPVTQVVFDDGGYDSEDEDLAWIAGAELKAYGLKLHYAYVYIEGDSIPWFVADSDWGSSLIHGPLGTEGHKFGVAYDLTKHCTLGATAILTDYIDANDLALDEDGAVYQLDLTYKF
jgi:hypothetical protein